VSKRFFAVALVAALLPSLPAAHAAPEIGSANTATAEPPIARPRTSPCTVTLFSNLAFADFSPKPFSYTPPADCPGPWSKVVLQADFSVTAGRQFDRTANFWIGGTNVYFGTTAEPSRTVSRSWHVERDLTDYSALLATAQAGEADLGNLVNGTYTGILYGSATLQFYPVEHHRKAPRVPDVVLPLAAGPSGGPVALANATTTLARSFTLPTNVERAYLDVIAQSQSNDEFWYTCVPDDVAGQLQSCGSTGFREVEVSIDGQPAGVAPVQPWIFTGGIDPYLWQPIVGVKTLNFDPYRVDLTPFAGLLSDGRPHEVALGVFNAHDYFSVTATLLLYRDHGAATVTGAVTANTLAAAPLPTVKEDLQTGADGSTSGTVTVRASRRYTIAGWVKTSHGTVRTEVTDRIDFENRQHFDISATKYVQQIKQATRVASLTWTRERGAWRDVARSLQWPLEVDISFVTNADGSSAQTTTIAQRDDRQEAATWDGLPVQFAVTADAVTTADTLSFDAAGAFLGPKDRTASQHYFSADATGACYSRALTAANGLLTAIDDQKDCGN